MMAIVENIVENSTGDKEGKRTSWRRLELLGFF